MFKIFGDVLKGVVGIFTKNSDAKNKLKQAKLDGELQLQKATIQAKIKRIESNTNADNNIDLETVKDMKTSIKDELLLITFVTPIFILLNIVPFMTAFFSKDWISLPSYIKESVLLLSSFPDWYKLAIGLLFIATYGFRGAFRKVLNNYLTKKS